MMTLGKIILIGVIGCCVALPQSNGGIDRRFGDCRKDSDCSPDECCLLNPMRYSTPTCSPRRTEGEICRPGAPVTVSTTLSYPDGSQIDVEGVHSAVCPCMKDLSCTPGVGVCDPIGKSPPHVRNSL